LKAATASEARREAPRKKVEDLMIGKSRMEILENTIVIFDCCRTSRV
jgi:hypothetical protein